MSEQFERNHAAPEVCGTCRYHQHEKTCDDWVCMCEEGEFFANWTGYEDTCECWETRT